MKIFGLVAAVALCSAPVFGSTMLVTSDPHSGTTTTFTDTGNNGFGNPGPVMLDGFSVTGSPQVTWGNASYFLGNNGTWNQSWIATNGTGSITFKLGGLYSFVGGFVNYFTPPFSPDPMITALGSDGVTVLGTYDLLTLAPIVTPGAINGGAFRGIQSTSADIAYLRLSGDYIVAHTLEVGAANTVTPEPSTLLLLGTGLVGAAGAFRRRLSL